MSSRWTPGPWRIQSSGWNANNVQEGGSIESVADTHGTYYKKPDGTVELTQGAGPTICHFLTTGLASKDEGRANAKLIAAAPELVECLRGCLSALEGNPLNPPQIQASRVRSLLQRIEE